MCIVGNGGKEMKIIIFILISFILIQVNFSFVKDTQKIIIFKNVKIVPMTKEIILENYNIIVKEGLITSIYPSNENKSIKSARVINGKGAYLMPGLADMHMHFESIKREPWPISHQNMYVANGVTTVRDLHGQQFINKLKDDINRGNIIGPSIITYPPITRGYEKNFLDLIDKYKEEGYHGIKLYEYFSLDNFKKAMHKAKKLNLNTIGHIPFNVGLDNVISENMNEIAHIIEIAWEFAELDISEKLDGSDLFDRRHEAITRKYGSLNIEKLHQKINKEAANIVSKLAGKGITVHTTLMVEKLVSKKVNEAENFFLRPLNKYLPERFFSNFVLGYDKHQVMLKNKEKVAQIVFVICEAILRQLKKQKIPIVLGTDSGPQSLALVPGASVYEELKILTENGFSPYEAFSTATRNAGILMEQITGKNEFGTIEEGKRADLILVNKNPLKSVNLIDSINGVMVKGKWYTKEKLNGMTQLNKDSIQSRTDFWKAAYKCVHYGLTAPLLKLLKEEKNVKLLKNGYNSLYRHYLNIKSFKNLPAAFKRVSEITLDTIKRVQLLNTYAWFIYQNKWKEQYLEGIKAVKESIKLYPKFGGTYSVLAWLFFENNQYDEAIKTMKQAVKVSPNKKVYKDYLKKMKKK